MFNIDPHMKTMREAPGRIDQVLADLQVAISKIKKDDQLSPAGRDEQISEARGKARRSVLEIRAAANEARANVERQTARELAGRDNLGLEDGLAHDRTWARLLRRLEGGTSAGQLVDETIAAGDTAGIAALRTELPQFLKATAPTRPGLGRRGMDRSATHAAEQLVARLDRAELSTLRFDQRDALAAKLELPALAKVVDAKAHMVLSQPSPSQRQALGVAPRSRLAAAYAESDAAREAEEIKAAVDA